MSDTPIVGCLGSGEKVVHRCNNHLHPDVAALLPEALGKIMSGEREFITDEIDLGRIVGKSICVATKPGDKIVFAQRPGRCGLTRFVLNRAPEPSSSVAVILKTASGLPGSYLLVTAYIGRKPKHEPWDRNAPGDALDWWNQRALIWESEAVRCSWCGETIAAPERAQRAGDLMVCVECAIRQDYRIVAINFPGWGMLDAPGR